MYDIFISYRRKSRAEELALLLYKKLIQDGFSVSHDHSTFNESKLPFDITIDKRIEECTDFICIVSHDSFERCTTPDYDIEQDWMVHEIQYALSQKKNIIPIRLDIESFPSNIPNPIERLKYYDGPHYSADYFDAFYTKLKMSLKTTSILTIDGDHKYEHAIYLMDHGNQAKGIEELFDAANNGSLGACTKLGQLYCRLNSGEPWNVKYDPQKALAWINKAYIKNYPPAYHELGLLYLWGLHVPKNLEKAVDLFKKGAELGNTDCMNELGICLLNGIGIFQDTNQAAILFEESADGGNSKGHLNYAMCCRDGVGVKKDSRSFFHHIKQAALMNEPLGHHYLAIAYFNGEGTEMNYEKAFSEFEKAYRMGELQDALNLAYCYEQGYGVEVSIERAKELLKECLNEAKEKNKTELVIRATDRLAQLEKM